MHQKPEAQTRANRYACHSPCTTQIGHQRAIAMSALNSETKLQQTKARPAQARRLTSACLTLSTGLWPANQGSHTASLWGMLSSTAKRQDRCISCGDGRTGTSKDGHRRQSELHGATQICNKVSCLSGKRCVLVVGADNVFDMPQLVTRQFELRRQLNRRLRPQ